MKFLPFALGVMAILLGVATVQAVTWDGSTDMNWSQPDNTSWSGATYNSGDACDFAGAGGGTITVDSGGVTPGRMTFTGTATDYTFQGGGIGGSGGVTRWPNATITFSSTNTHSGDTLTYNTGNLVFRGKESVPTNTKFRLESSGEHRVGNKISFLMDDAGIVNLGNEVEMTGNASYEYGTALYEIHVGNNGGTTTGSTIALGKMDFTRIGGNENTARIVRSTGANGYRLQFGDVDLNRFFDGTSENAPQGFYSDTAPITIVGTVKQIDLGTLYTDRANGVFLGGTGTTTVNYVTGLIKNADEYDDGSNTNLGPVFVRIGGPAFSGEFSAPQSDAIWCLSSSNSYSGGTDVRYGTLIADAAHALGDGDVEVSRTTGALIINAPGAIVDTASLSLPDDSTETLTMNADDTVGSLFLGGVPQPDGRYTSTEAWLGGSGTLSVGVVSPPNASILSVW